MDPLQTPLLVFGTCSEADFPEYERYFNETYRAGPVFDRFGRRVIITPDRAHHVCFANPRHNEQKVKSRPVWREDRAQRMPWIMVAFTHSTCLLKENKEPGMWNYLIRMQIIHPVMDREYYMVVVEPRKKGEEVRFVSAYKIGDHEWQNAMKRKSVPWPRIKREAEGTEPPASR